MKKVEKERLREIHDGFRLLGLGHDFERNRLLELSEKVSSEDKTPYRVYTAGDTRSIAEVNNAELESDTQ